MELSSGDLAYLTGRYDPKNMTAEEYCDFVDDLCRMGVLEESDKDFAAPVIIGGTELTRVDFSALGMTSTPVSSGYNSAFSSSGGNVLAWARHLATYEFFDEKTQSFAKTRSAVLFDMITDVLDQMAV